MYRREKLKMAECTNKEVAKDEVDVQEGIELIESDQKNGRKDSGAVNDGDAGQSSAGNLPAKKNVKTGKNPQEKISSSKQLSSKSTSQESR